MTLGKRTVFLFLTVWFVLALCVGMSGRFEAVSAPVVAGTLWTLTIVSLLACWFIQRIREWARQVNLWWLIALHLTRFVGFYFLLLCHRAELSCAFAKPAGIGDVFVAFIALNFILAGRILLKSRSLVLSWNSIGLVDIVFVVFNALRVGLADPQSMASLRTLPLSLLPMFLVPLIIASHVLIFARVLSGRGFQPRV